MATRTQTSWISTITSTMADLTRRVTPRHLCRPQQRHVRGVVHRINERHSLARRKATVSERTSRSSATNSFAGGGATGTTPTPTGNRRQQYTIAELPFVCDFCQARYKTKPGLQYHLAKHKDGTIDHRPSSSVADNGRSSLSPTSASVSPSLMKQKYANVPMDHQPHPMYPNQPGYPPYMNGAPNMPPAGYPMNHQPPPPYGMPPHPQHYPMPPSASMPLTVAALSGSSPANGMPYYPQQQQPPPHMMMMHPHPQPPPPAQPAKQPAPVSLGSQCDFCGGDEQENKTTKLSEHMITCKVRSFETLWLICVSLCPTGLRWVCSSDVSQIHSEHGSTSENVPLAMHGM